MPIVHKYKNGRGFYIKANQGGKITTYQVTGAGVALLNSRGHGDCSPLSPPELMRLAKQGHVYTGGSGPGEIDPVAGSPVAPPPYPPPKAAPVQSQSQKKNKLSRRERKRMRQAAAPPLPAPPVCRPSPPPAPVPPDPPLGLAPDDTDEPGLGLLPLDTQPVTPSADPDERRPEVPPLDPPPSTAAPPVSKPAARSESRDDSGGLVRSPVEQPVTTAEPPPLRVNPPAKRLIAATLAVLFIFPAWLLVMGFLSFAFLPKDVSLLGKIAIGVVVVGTAGGAAMLAYRSEA
jgi:hypothetical protein